MLILAKLLKHKERAKRELTFQNLSEAFGHKDRQGSHNYYREFEGCGGDMLSFLRRENKLEDLAFELIEKQILKSPLLPLPEHYAIFTDTHPEIRLSKPTFRSYVRRIDSSKVLARIRGVINHRGARPK